MVFRSTKGCLFWQLGLTKALWTRKGLFWGVLKFSVTPGIFESESVQVISPVRHVSENGGMVMDLIARTGLFSWVRSSAKEILDFAFLRKSVPRISGSEIVGSITKSCLKGGFLF